MAFESFDSSQSKDSKYDKFKKFMPKLNARELNNMNILVANRELQKKGKNFRQGYTPAFVVEKGWGGKYSRSVEHGLNLSQDSKTSLHSKNNRFSGR